MIFKIFTYGSHISVITYLNYNNVIIRPYIEIPESSRKKWGNQYILIRDVSKDDIDKIKNHKVITINGVFLKDKKRCNYISGKIIEDCETPYGMITLSGNYDIPHNIDIIRNNSVLSLPIFSIAYNNKPPIFEAILVLKNEDIVCMNKDKYIYRNNNLNKI